MKPPADVKVTQPVLVKVEVTPQKPVVVQLNPVPSALTKRELPLWVDWLSAFTFLVPLIATIVGWKIVASQNDRRERRKDIRDQLTEIRSRLKQIGDWVAEYVNTGPTDASCAILAARIVSDIQSVEKLIKITVTAGLPFNNWGKVVALRQAATDGDFQTLARQSGDPGRLSAVADASADLVESLDAVYFTKFPLLPS